MKPVPYKSLQRQPSLADQVVEQIKDLISSRHLRPGDKLPPERELAEYLGVSRTVIREATRSLTAQGLLEIRPSSGMVIAKPSSNAVAETVGLYLQMNAEDSYTELFEVRRLLEVEIAGLAAERATISDLDELEELLQFMVTNLGKGHRVSQADVRFHNTLAKATHNRIFPLLLDSIGDLLLELREKAAMIPGNVEVAMYHHARILEQVKSRNPEGARQAMLEHIIEGERHMRMAMPPVNKK